MESAWGVEHGEVSKGLLSAVKGARGASLARAGARGFNSGYRSGEGAVQRTGHLLGKQKAVGRGLAITPKARAAKAEGVYQGELAGRAKAQHRNTVMGTRPKSFLD